MTKNILLRQHSQLLYLGAEIEKLLLAPANREKLAEKFNDYIELVREHFYEEERHLMSCHPEQFSEHVQKHKAYQRYLFKLCAESPEVIALLAPEILTTWWVKHIKEVDALYLEDQG
jgi:hemerythrin-like metal-binding protein